MKIFPIILAAIFILLAGTASAGAQDVLRLGLLGNKFDKPFATGVVGWAQERRLFENALEPVGVKVEWVFFKGGAPALNEGIANGKIDIAVYGDVGSIAGKGGGLPTKVIAPNGVGGGKSYILVGAGSSIRTAADLRGKRVALQRGTAPQLLFYRWAHLATGLNGRDFKLLNLSGTDQETALASGAADVLVGGNLDLVDRGSARVLATIDTDKERTLAGCGNVVATESYIKEHPDRVAKWVDAFVQAATELLDERRQSEYVRLGTKNGTSAKNVRLNRPKDLLATSAPVFDDYYRTRLRAAISDSKTFGIIDRDIDVKEWVEPRFLDESLRRRGLAEAWGRLHESYASEAAP